MKKILFVLGCFCFFSLHSYTSFSQAKKPVAKTTKKGGTSKAAFTVADIKAGENLISKSDCMACHQLKTKVVGPAYDAVAEKYSATDENVMMLVNKIIKGGSGSWGQVPMSPHPTVAVGEAKKMVAFILSLKGK